MLNLENHKKQAKRVLRWHKERHWPLAQVIRDTLPAFRNLTDRDVFEREFRLADAQELVARNAGFGSWEQLRKSAPESADADDGSVVDESGTSRVLRAIPFLRVTDIEAAIRYYKERLGFGKAVAYGDPPFYAEVVRGDVRLALRHVDAGPSDEERTLRRTEELLSASITVDAAKPLFQEVSAAGAAVFQPLRTEPWGSRTFIVEDPDGNLIAFWELGGDAEADD